MTAEPKELLERQTAVCARLIESLERAISAISRAHFEQFVQEISVQREYVRQMSDLQARFQRVHKAGDGRHGLAEAAAARNDSFRRLATVNAVYRRVVKKSLVTCSALLQITREVLPDLRSAGRGLEVHV